MVLVSDYAYLFTFRSYFQRNVNALATFLYSTAGYIALISLLVFVLYTSSNFLVIIIVCTNKEWKCIIKWMFSYLATN